MKKKRIVIPEFKDDLEKASYFEDLLQKIPKSKKLRKAAYDYFTSTNQFMKASYFV